jgi:hypothetical protein
MCAPHIGRGGAAVDESEKKPASSMTSVVSGKARPIRMSRPTISQSRASILEAISPTVLASSQKSRSARSRTRGGKYTSRSCRKPPGGPKKWLDSSHQTAVRTIRAKRGIILVFITHLFTACPLSKISAPVGRKTAVSFPAPYLIRCDPGHKNIKLAVAGHVTDGNGFVPVMANCWPALKRPVPSLSQTRTAFTGDDQIQTAVAVQDPPDKPPCVRPLPSRWPLSLKDPYHR